MTSTTTTKEAIRCEGGDWWICLCGNEPDQDGFVACDAGGDAVEPTPRAWPEPLYACQRCGRIVHAETLDVVGRQASAAPGARRLPIAAYLKRIGKRGGEETKKRYGKDHFKELVRKRWAKKKAAK